MKTILVTGAAGFIGFHVSQALLNQGHRVVGVDNLSDYYDVNLKQARIDQLSPDPKFTFHRLDLADRAATAALFKQGQFDRVIHLAAQPGVRYSIDHPHAYVDSNLVAFVNIVEGCRHYPVEHFVYASSSSVYGANKDLPFATDQNVDHPVSLYAATKKANELMAYTYSHLYGIPTTGLRFFTVYGPWGRPDMAMFKFTKAILEGQPLQVYNHGNMMRDFTYIDDIVDGVVRIADHIPQGEAGLVANNPPYKLYNIGNNRPVSLLKFIETLEAALGIEADKHFLPMQPGDVPATYADITALTQAVGFQPRTAIEVGIPRFVDWYRAYYGVSSENVTPLHSANRVLPKRVTTRINQETVASA
ncbi:MAG: NAD-dependent epimerase [Leptolyngbya sp. RL_3_1]|nr:NAD-dependent epimerase [Leptolyngbya sp. RL_3_1]